MTDMGFKYDKLAEATMRKVREKSKQKSDRTVPGTPDGKDSRKSGLSRRGFLGRVGGLGSATVIATMGLEPLLDSPRSRAHANPIGPLGPADRADLARQVRIDAADFNRFSVPLPVHVSNGDEAAFANRIGSFSKGLPHSLPLGEVDPAAYDALLGALSTGDPDLFESIPMGSPDHTRQRRLVNPQAGMAFDLQGTDSHQFTQPPAPEFASAWRAGEIVENYWMALLRDVNFTDYDHHPLAVAAADDLSRISDYRGPREGGRVTPQVLFRDPLPGALAGPYVSQFLLKPAPFGGEFVERRMRTVVAGVDYMTSFADWYDVQNGVEPQLSDRYDQLRRYIRNGRDLGQWVHVDVLFQAYFDACLILLTPPDRSDRATGGGIGCPLNPGNPYNDSRTQEGFGTFGAPHIKTLLCEVATRALKAVWFQKWFVHRRVRPEAFAGRVHFRATGQADYPVHPDALNSDALRRIYRQNGTGFLPMAYPEGSPLHPAYGAGHATVAGACVTMLKALFDEDFLVPDPVVPDPAGQRLLPYTGPDRERLTVGGELNKLASNIATGRNHAGVHYRTDGIESFRLGEAVAISLLRDHRATYNEKFQGFTFTTFDGVRITV
ncbi:MAG TPA: vanadium-dependent haloperoxidase [Gammaproteobacteria bacterium]|nr:vanadium-dependent haloperoxidase [Gammaproteobacteria bacterium]